MMLKLIAIHKNAAFFDVCSFIFCVSYCFISLKSVHLQRLNI